MTLAIKAPTLRRIIPFVLEYQFAQIVRDTTSADYCPEPLLASRTAHNTHNRNRVDGKRISIDMLFDARMEESDAIKFCQERFCRVDGFHVNDETYQFSEPVNGVRHLTGDFILAEDDTGN